MWMHTHLYYLCEDYHAGPLTSSSARTHADTHAHTHTSLGVASKGIAAAHDNCTVLKTIFIGKIRKGLVSAHPASTFYSARVRILMFEQLQMKMRSCFYSKSR